MDSKKDKNTNNVYKNKLITNYSFWAIQIVCIVLLIIAVYQDIFHNLLNFRNLGVHKIVSDKVFNYLIKVLGAYGLIQVFAQDIGIPTGNLQKEITHYPISKYMLLFSSGYALTGDRSETLVATMIYFYLRNILSTQIISTSTWKEKAIKTN